MHRRAGHGAAARRASRRWRMTGGRTRACSGEPEPIILIETRSRPGRTSSRRSARISNRFGDMTRQLIRVPARTPSRAGSRRSRCRARRRRSGFPAALPRSAGCDARATPSNRVVALRKKPSSISNALCRTIWFTRRWLSRSSGERTADASSTPINSPRNAEDRRGAAGQRSECRAKMVGLVHGDRLGVEQHARDAAGALLRAPTSTSRDTDPRA